MMDFDAHQASISEGFDAERLVVLPLSTLTAIRDRPFLSRVVVTACGYFPRARLHGVTRPHGTDELIVIACVAGRGWCELNGRRYAVRPGEVVILPPRAEHSYGADREDPWTVWWMHLGGTDLAEVSALIGAFADRPVREVHDIFRVASILQTAVDRLSLDLSDSAMLSASASAFELVSRICSGTPASASTRSVIDASREFLLSELNSTVTVAELASMSALSPSHFAASFRDHVGMPAGRFHTHAKMARARELLDMTDLPIAEIARTVGYEDTFYFSRQFKKIHGRTASAYRRQTKG